MRKTARMGMMKTTDAELSHEWEDFVKSTLPRKIERFTHEDARDGSGGLLPSIIWAIRAGDPYKFIDPLKELSEEDSGQQQYETYKEYVREFAKDYENEEEVVREIEDDLLFREKFDDIWFEREVFNWWILVQDVNLLVWNTKTARSIGWVGDPQDIDDEIEENSEIEEWYEEAIQYVSAKQIRTILLNGLDYDVTAFIGGIVDAGEVLKAMTENTQKITYYPADEIVVGVWDGLNGAGMFEHGTTNAALSLVFGDKSNPIHVDFGSYSLGDIFGGVDWTWR